MSSLELSETQKSGATAFFSNLPVEDTPGDIHRLFWTQWIRPFCGFGSGCTKHERCWGNTIIRTSYDNNHDKFARAVAAIRRLAMVPIEYDYEQRGTGEARDQPAEDGPEIDEDFRIHVTTEHAWIRQSLQEAYQGMIKRARRGAPPGVRCTHDWVVTHELMSWYHNDVVEDKVLDDKVSDKAGLSAAWDYFQANCEKHVSGLRGQVFVLLDQESIDHLSSAPNEQELGAMTPLERARVSWQHWIKVVTTRCNVVDGEHIEDEISHDAMGRRRIRLFDYFDIYLRLQSIDISEIGVEGNDREHFPGYELEDEWLLCGNSDEDPDTWPWLKEIYGEWAC